MEGTAAVGVAVQAARHIGREDGALRSFFGKTELARLIKATKAAVKAEARIPHEHRDAVADVVGDLTSQFPVVGILYRYLEEGDDAALTDLAKEVARLLPSSIEPEPERTRISEVVAEIVRDVAPEAFRSEVEADQFDHKRTRATVAAEGAATRDEIQQGIGDLRALIERQQGQKSVVLTATWAPEVQRRMLKELAELDGDLARRIDEILESSDAQIAGERAAELIEHPEGWMLDGPAVLWALLASMAQRKGEWVSAARGWEEASTRFGGMDDLPKQADTLVSAAVALEMAGDKTGHDALLEQARGLSPRNARIALGDAGLADDADERLALLADIEAEGEVEHALLHLNRGLAHLMKLETDTAERELNEALKYGGERVQTRMLRINIAVQRGREAVAFGRSVDGRRLRQTLSEAKDLRAELLTERRYEESIRVLMLAADAAMLDEGPEAGTGILREATDEEQRWPDGAEILGDAALRAQNSIMARSLTASAVPTPAIRRIRAMAEIKMLEVSASNKLEACAELDSLVGLPGNDGLEAAGSRCLACLMDSDLPWSEVAEDRLRGTDLETMATAIHAIQTARSENLAAADALLDGATLEPKASAEIRFQCALEATGEGAEAARRATEFLKYGTDQAMEAICAIAYFNASDLQTAGIHATRLSEDTGAPKGVRLEMFRLRCKIAERQSRWSEAARLVDEALWAFPTDDWLNAFRTRAAARS